MHCKASAGLHPLVPQRPAWALGPRTPSAVRCSQLPCPAPSPSHLPTSHHTHTPTHPSDQPLACAALLPSLSPLCLDFTQLRVFAQKRLTTTVEEDSSNHEYYEEVGGWTTT